MALADRIALPVCTKIAHHIVHDELTVRRLKEKLSAKVGYLQPCI